MVNSPLAMFDVAVCCLPSGEHAAIDVSNEDTADAVAGSDSDKECRTETTEEAQAGLQAQNAQATTSTPAREQQESEEMDEVSSL